MIKYWHYSKLLLKTVQNLKYNHVYYGDMLKTYYEVYHRNIIPQQNICLNLKKQH